MIKYYRTMDHQIHEISEPMEGTWISLVHPTAAELATIAAEYKIDIDDLILKKNTCIVFSAWCLTYCYRFQSVFLWNNPVLF